MSSAHVKILGLILAGATTIAGAAVAVTSKAERAEVEKVREDVATVKSELARRTEILEALKATLAEVRIEQKEMRKLIEEILRRTQ